MDNRFIQKYIIWSRDLAKIFLEELGLPDDDYDWKDISKEAKEEVQLVKEILYGWKITLNGNNTFLDCDPETFYCKWKEEEIDENAKYGQELKMRSRIYQAYNRLVERGEIPEEFIIHVWW